MTHQITSKKLGKIRLALSPLSHKTGSTAYFALFLASTPTFALPALRMRVKPEGTSTTR